MPRRPRIRLADMTFHVIQRGNNRGRCFFVDEDYRRYLAYAAEQACLHRVAVHAYVLMTNHTHLLLTPATEDGVSEMMKALGQLYAQYVNRKYQRTGSLWEGRFHSCLVDSEAYLLTCYRYIESNPVRAGMVRNAGNYRWSSHRCNADGVLDPLVTPHNAVLALADDPALRRRAYRQLFSEPLAAPLLEEIRTATRGGHALGTAEFRNRLERSLGRTVEKQKSGPKPKAERPSAKYYGSDPELDPNITGLTRNWARN